MKAPLVVSLLLSSLLSAYEAHEWGTFTTVSASDGTMLSGLHVEEEHLPPFVHSHVGMAPSIDTLSKYRLSTGLPIRHLNSTDQIAVRLEKKGQTVSAIYAKGLPSALLQNVTVKMETPVIYFYGDDTPKVNVKVGFNGGTISQWYPMRKSGDTPNKGSLAGYTPKGRNTSLFNGEKIAVDFTKPIDFSKPYSGFIEWDVEILPSSQSDTAYTFKPFENYTWIYPRVPDANMLKVGEEYEDYLFYRGIGNFEIPATFSVDANETLTISNKSKEPIPFAFAFENIQGQYRYKALNDIPAHDTISVSENDWITPKNQQIEVFQIMRSGLISQGLTMDEANGMVRTWWKSYFDKPGLRVFWVVPSYELEKTLPLELTPEPEKIVRVMVGRADVLRPSFEQRMIDVLGTSMFDHFQKDRFYLPYKQRLEQLIKKPVFSKLNDQGISMQSFPIKAVSSSSQQTGTIRLYTGTEVSILNSNASDPNQWGISGDWKILDSNTLQIGEHTFSLDPQKGTLTADLPEGSKWNYYEIQLKRYLN
jgi:hypothetical protein